MMQIDFPFHFDERGRTATTNETDHVRDMIEQLLLTSPGERVNRPDLGTSLMQMVFAANSPELAATLQYTIQAALQTWLGDIVGIEALEVTCEDATLRVQLEYVVLRTGERRNETFTQGAP